MTTSHRRLLVAALLASPLLLTVSEAARLTVDTRYVESDDPVADTAAHVAAVADHLMLWHVAGFTSLAFVITWAGALAAMVLMLAPRAPRAAAAGGVLAVLSVVGAALHTAFYYLPLAELAGADDAGAAARAGAAISGDDPLSVTALLLFLLGGLLAPLVLGLSLWRARVVPWWAAAGVVAWTLVSFLGLESVAAAAANLLLLVPAVAVARRLAPAADRVTTQAVAAVG